MSGGLRSIMTIGVMLSEPEGFHRGSSIHCCQSPRSRRYTCNPCQVGASITLATSSANRSARSV